MDWIRKDVTLGTTIFVMPSGKQGPSGPFAQAVSAQVRAAIGRHGTSATKVAAQMGVSQSYMSKRIRNRAAFTLNDLAAICEVLGENPFDLIHAARGDAPDA